MHNAQTSSANDPRAQQPITVERVSSLDELNALQTDWDRLAYASEAPNVFTTFVWYRTWIARRIEETGSGRLEPFVLVARQNEAIVGIAPLVRRIAVRGGLPVRKIEFVTTHSDYNELVIGSDVPALTAAMLNALALSADNWDILDLMDLRNDTDQTSQLERAAVRAGLGYRSFAEPDGCLYMPIHAPWSETSTRKQLRFARRASLAFGQRALEGFHARVIDQPHLESELLQRLIAVEAQKHVAGKLSQPVVGRYRDVFQALVDTLGPRGEIAIVVVEQNNRLIAWRWLYCCGTKLWDYLTAYDHAFSELSPGTILLCKAIDYGFAHGFDEFDFLRGMDAYKQRWTSTFRSNRHIVLWNRRWKSRFASWALLWQDARIVAENKQSAYATQPLVLNAANAPAQKGSYRA